MFSLEPSDLDVKCSDDIHSKMFFWDGSFTVCLWYLFVIFAVTGQKNFFPSSKGPVLSGAAMSAKAISEQTGKEFLYKHISISTAVQNRFRYASVTAETDWDRLTQDHPWLLTEVSCLIKLTKLTNLCGYVCGPVLSLIC